MSLVVFCADKGSPGVTTSALAVAAAWPRPAVLAELDPSGGDLALRLTDSAGRYLLAARPGLLTWAAAARLGSGPSVREHCQSVSGGLPVLPGVAGAEQAAGLSPLWPRLAGALGGVSDVDVLADLGRLLPGSPLLPVAAAADLLVVVTTATIEGLVHARDRLRALVAFRSATAGADHRGPGVALLVVAGDRRGPQAVEAAQLVIERERLPAPVVGFLAVDPAGVVALHRTQRADRPTRTLLARTARSVAGQLYGLLPSPPSAPSAAVAPAGASRVAVGTCTTPTLEAGR